MRALTLWRKQHEKENTTRRAERLNKALNKSERLGKVHKSYMKSLYMSTSMSIRQGSYVCNIVVGTAVEFIAVVA